MEGEKTHESVRPHHPHTHETLSRYRLHLLAQPSLLEGMATRDRLPKARANHLPPLTVIVEPEYAHELLEMVVEHGVVHARVDVFERLADDRVAGHDVQRDPRRCEEGRRVHAQAAKVADDEAAKLVRLREREARDGVLRMCLERDAILQHRRQEGGKEEAHETAEFPANRVRHRQTRPRAAAAHRGWV